MLCGFRENCFENGEEQWGHMGGVLCKHASEKHDERTSSQIGACGKTGEPVEAYTTQREYDALKR